MRFLKLGATALVGVFLASATVAPAVFAQTPPAAVQVSRDMVTPLNEARAAIVAKDWPTATAKLTAAAAKAKTPADKAQLDRLRLVMAAETKDYPGQLSSINGLLASGTLTPDEIKQYKGALIKIYADMGDPAKSLAASREYVDTYGGSHEMMAALANDYAKAGDNASSLLYVDKAIAAARTAGAKPPEAYYRLKARVHQGLKDQPGYYKTLEALLADYPKDTYWVELIARAQNEPQYGVATRLDMYRTLIAAGVQLTPEQKANAAHEAIERGLPGEALGLLESAGALNSERDKENLDNARTQAPKDKAGLAAETASIVSKGDASAIASIGEAHLSYGDYPKAVELLQSALSKGIANAAEADVARLHLGIAQYRSGDKDGARTTWAAIKADNGAAVLAQNWTLISKLK
jgi:tetratricopeptide (TPR) repeat protein